MTPRQRAGTLALDASRRNLEMHVYTYDDGAGGSNDRREHDMWDLTLEVPSPGGVGRSPRGNPGGHAASASLTV